MTYPVIVVREPDRSPIYLSIREPLEIGRDCGGLLVEDAVVSRRHLEVANIEGSLVVTDLGSSNGTTLDGQPLTMPMRLSEGSMVRLGSVTIELVVERGGGNRDTMSPAPAQIDAKATLAPGAGVAARVQPVGGGADARMTSIDMLASTVTNDDMQAVSSASQGTVTIVFSDIESSTQRNVALGDQVWFEVLQLHNEIVGRSVTRFGGTEIKNQGDGFMLSFPSARRALQAMICVQQELAALEASDPQRSVRVRMGLHTGEALVDNGDLFGTHVVIAARVANLADGGEILVSSLTRDIVAARGDVAFGNGREAELKGIGSQTVFPVDWSEQLAD